MTSLADKLKSLGVKVGAQHLPPPKPRHPIAIEKVLGGSFLNTPFGEIFIKEAYYPYNFYHGRVALGWNSLPYTLAAWAKDERLPGLSPQSFVFLDTETTGLSGGTGIYVFLVGVARFEGDVLHLVQFFMRDPAEEIRLLAALEEFLAPCQALVTFNGKSFDLPLIITRYLSHGWPVPFAEYTHIDLLHLARRLWRERLSSHTLYNLEYHILGATRTEEDLPGWMIPQIYFDYLTSGDARPLKRVFYHNAFDVISLAALFSYITSLLAEPIQNPPENAQDMIALAKLFEDLAEIEAAMQLYLKASEYPLSASVLSENLHHLGMLHKKQGNLHLAVPLWEQAAQLKHLHAHIELAKFYEHRQQDYREAIFWTRSALYVLEEVDLPPGEKQNWHKALHHRLTRLLRKEHER